MNQRNAKWVADVPKFDHRSPVCKYQRALKWINPTDMFSSPTVPAFKSNKTQWLLQYIISTSADISHPVFEAVREPDDQWKTTEGSPLGSKIKVSFYKHSDVSPERSLPKTD